MSAVDRFRAAAGDDLEVRTFAESTRTADEAARAVGCEVGQIVKSLVFVADGEPVLALVGGDRRLDAAAFRARLGASEVRRASADEVRVATGFSIGGVPPFGHRRELRCVMDTGLLAHDVVWAAAGTPNHVFAIAPRELASRAGAELAEVGTDAGAG